MRSMGRILMALAAMAALGATEGDYVAARRKIELIQQEQAPAGSRIALDRDELNAFVRRELAEVAPLAVRGARVELGSGRATGYAMIDFARLEQSDNRAMRWLIQQLVGGERPVRIDARIRSGAGQAVVDVDSVEISGMTITGGALDFLIQKFLWIYYPDAKIGEPFALAHRIDRLEVNPHEVGVVIGR